MGRLGTELDMTSVSLDILMYKEKPKRKPLTDIVLKICITTFAHTSMSNVSLGELTSGRPHHVSMYVPKLQSMFTRSLVWYIQTRYYCLDRSERCRVLSLLKTNPSREMRLLEKKIPPRSCFIMTARCQDAGVAFWLQLYRNFSAPSKNCSES